MFSHLKNKTKKTPQELIFNTLSPNISLSNVIICLLENERRKGFCDKDSCELYFPIP